MQVLLLFSLFLLVTTVLTSEGVSTNLTLDRDASSDSESSQSDSEFDFESILKNNPNEVEYISACHKLDNYSDIGSLQEMRAERENLISPEYIRR